MPLVVSEVGLVAHQADDYVRPPLRPNVLDPLGRVEKAVAVGNVVDDDCDGAVANVAGDEAAEALLARRVPQLQPHCSVIQVHCLAQKVNADGRLVMPVEIVVHEPRNNRGLAHRLVAQKDELVLGQRRQRRVRRALRGRRLARGSGCGLVGHVSYVRESGLLRYGQGREREAGVLMAAWLAAAVALLCWDLCLLIESRTTRCNGAREKSSDETDDDRARAENLQGDERNTNTKGEKANWY